MKKISTSLLLICFLLLNNAIKGQIYPNIKVLTNVSAQGKSDGRATCNPSGGTPPYTYMWTPGGNKKDTATNLSAGTYTIIVQDNKGVKDSALIMITQPTFVTKVSSISDLSNNLNILKQNTDALNKRDSILEKSLNMTEQIIYASVGGNIDFLNNVKVNGIYFDVNLSLPRLLGNTKDSNRWIGKVLGVEARINQGQIISRPDTTSTSEYDYSSTITKTNYTKVQVSYSNLVVTYADYISAELTPTFKLLGNSNSSALYLPFMLDFYQYESTIKTNQDILSIDSVRNTPSSPDTANKQPFKSVNSSTTFLEYTFDIGAGIMYTFNSKDVSFSIKCIAGYGHIHSLTNLNSNYGIFYDTRVEAFENIVGFKVGFEIRGLTAVSGNDTYVLTKAPNFSLYFAKTINFSNLKSLLQE